MAIGAVLGAAAELFQEALASEADDALRQKVESESCKQAILQAFSAAI